MLWFSFFFCWVCLNTLHTYFLKKFKHVFLVKETKILPNTVNFPCMSKGLLFIIKIKLTCSCIFKGSNVSHTKQFIQNADLVFMLQLTIIWIIHYKNIVLKDFCIRLKQKALTKTIMESNGFKDFFYNTEVTNKSLPKGAVKSFSITWITIVYSINHDLSNFYFEILMTLQIISRGYIITSVD